MCKKLLSMLLTLTLLVTALPFGALAQEEAPVNEPTIEKPAASQEPTATEEPTTQEEPVAPEGTDEPAGEEEPTVITTPEPPVLTPEELFIAAVALLPTEPVETVTAELLTQLSEVTEQMNALVTEQQLAAIEAGEPVEGMLEALLEAVQAVLALTARVNELNAAAAAAVEAMIVALPAADELTHESEAQVTQAATAYAALLVEQQALITEETVALLDAAQAKLAELIARANAEKVDELISQLPPAQDINIDNYTDYQDTAELASNELSVLSDYEREFVSLESKLAGVEIAIKTSEEAAAVKALLDALPKTEQEALDNLTFDTTKPNSIDKVFAAEQAYQDLSDEEKDEIQDEYAAFEPTYAVAQELQTICDQFSIMLDSHTSSFILPIGSAVETPTMEWWGISSAEDEELAEKYPLTLEMPEDETYIKRVNDENGDRIVGVALTEDTDAVALVYGTGAAALKEIAKRITFTVLPEKDDNDLGTTAYVANTTVELNKAYSFTAEGMSVQVLFSVGKYLEINMPYDGATVAFTSKKAAELFDVWVSEDEERNTFVAIKSDLYDTIKSGTYRTKLVYTVPVGDDTVTVTTDEIKLVVKNSMSKLRFATQTINTFYYDSQAESSFYPTVWMNPVGTWDAPEGLTFIKNDDTPFTIRYDADNGFALEVEPYCELEDKTYKASFIVDSDIYVSSYEMKLTIKAKRTPPSLKFTSKTYQTTNRSYINASMTIVASNKKTNLYDIGVKDAELAPTSDKYPYQDDFAIRNSYNSGEKLYVDINLESEELPDGVQTVPLLVSVTFEGSEYAVDLPMKIVLQKSKVKLLQGTVQLPQLSDGEAATAYAYYELTDDYEGLMLDSYTVNGVSDEEEECALYMAEDVDYSYYTNGNGHSYDYARIMIEPTEYTEYGKNYKVVLTLSDGRTLKLTVNTKAVQNKLKMGQANFKLDFANESDYNETTLTPTYLCDSSDETFQLQAYDTAQRAWVDADDLLTAEWTEHRTFTFSAGKDLTVGKTKFRIYATAQGIPSDKATVFTVTATRGKIKLSSKMYASKTNVLSDASYVNAFVDVYLTNLGNGDYWQNFRHWYNPETQWEYTLAEEGAEYLQISGLEAGVADPYLSWKNPGSEAMKTNGLKPLKLSLQVRNSETKELVAQSKTFTLSLCQPVKLDGTKTVQLYKQMPYELGYFSITMRDTMEDVGLVATGVTIKNAESSNYRVHVREFTTGEAYLRIGYKNLDAAKRAKTNETITLLVELENGVKPVEYKVKVTNVK